jgi:L-gulonolactone oxidase
VDRENRLVRVEGGITLHDLNETLAANELALENLGDIDVQSIAGATATATHGTGARYRNLSANLQSIELLLADGSHVTVSERDDPDAWRAARVSLGALGVVTAVTIKALPAFTLRGVDATSPLEEVLAGLDELVAENEHFEFYTFPHSPIAMTRTNNRVDDEPRPRSRASAWMHDIMLVNHMFNLVCRTGRRFPSLIPKLNRMSARLSGGSERIDRSYRIFASPRLVRFTETEYAIPREHAVEAIRACMDLVEREDHDVPFPFEVRFVAPDDAFLSPPYGRDTAYVAVHQFEKMKWEQFFRSVQSIMDELDGRPHWGKRHFQTAETLAPRFPEWARFQSVRARLDPDGLFANEHVDRVLGVR